PGARRGISQQARGPRPPPPPAEPEPKRNNAPAPSLDPTGSRLVNLPPVVGEDCGTVVPPTLSSPPARMPMPSQRPGAAPQDYQRMPDESPGLPSEPQRKRVQPVPPSVDRNRTANVGTSRGSNRSTPAQPSQQAPTRMPMPTVKPQVPPQEDFRPMSEPSPSPSAEPEREDAPQRFDGDTRRVVDAETPK